MNTIDCSRVLVGVVCSSAFRLTGDNSMNATSRDVPLLTLLACVVALLLVVNSLPVPLLPIAFLAQRRKRLSYVGYAYGR